MKKSRFILFAICIFLTGCQLSNLNSQKPVESMPSAVNGGTPAPDITKTAIPLRSTPSPTTLPTVTPTASPAPSETSTTLPTVENLGFVQQCLPITESWPEGFQIEGKLIRYCEGGACALSFQNKIAQDALFAKFDLTYAHVAISSDRQMLAYQRVTLDQTGKPGERYLYLMNSDGREPVSGRWLADWRLDGWRDLERLNLDRWEGEQHYVSMYDLETQEKATETLLPPLLHAYPDNQFISDARQNYNPTYDRVVYLYVDYDDDSRVYYALWDVWSGELLWKRIKDEFLFGTRWSPDGQQFAVASDVEGGKDELFVVSRDGQERQLTNLKAVYPDMNVGIVNYEWSLDGQYIALWLNIRPGMFIEEYNFAVVNLGTGELVDTCLPSDRNKVPHSIWSPDSQQIAVQIFESDNLSEPKIVIVDLKQNQAVRLPYYYQGYLFGWMK